MLSTFHYVTSVAFRVLLHHKNQLDNIPSKEIYMPTEQWHAIRRKYPLHVIAIELNT